MKRSFCDICDRLIVDATNGKSLELTGAVNGLQLVGAVQANIPSLENGGDVCKYCVIEAVKRLDDRPENKTASREE